MADINLSSIQEITSAANQHVDFSDLRFPYLESYKDFNERIISAAKTGRNSVMFDFVLLEKEVDKSKSLSEIEMLGYRIYLSASGGQADIHVYNYPSYLLGKGFKVKVINTPKDHKHGYSTKTYLVSW